jgi:hypothetical protein
MSTMIAGHVGMPVETVQGFAADAVAAADAAFGRPARSLLDASPARPAALEVNAAVRAAAAMYDEAVAKRAELARDKETRPQVLLERLREFEADWSARAEAIKRVLSVEAADKLETALQAEALPVSGDPAKALLARQEIELALELAAKNNESPIFVMQRLAARGGEVAAAIGSEWGRMRYQKASGVTEGYEVARDAAIETALNAADEGPRRAATALRAMKTRPRGGRPEAGYEARIKAITVLGEGRQVLGGDSPRR